MEKIKSFIVKIEIRYNNITILICNNNGIEITRFDYWKSIRTKSMKEIEDLILKIKNDPKTFKYLNKRLFHNG